ncbi:protein zwilch homolog isoform X2 [Harpegnathos saltator]|uniref:protein zwilch homolog isoform X2 n=1 Tax=Harpegnathos saltator TaxID=610380 RepID=UPI000DBEE9D9|nr:protein zwilch homolog isoform X2 [Harpegnathos saltator]
MINPQSRQTSTIFDFVQIIQFQIVYVTIYREIMMERLNEVLPHVQASEVRLSYVEELFPDLKDHPYIVLHKNVPGIPQSAGYKENREKNFAKHDVSGSPLEYSFGSCKFDDTVIITRNSWRKEEESYLPLSINDACNALNIYLEYSEDNTLPVLALCDGKDSKQSRLIGSIIRDNCFITLRAVSIGIIPQARSKYHEIVQEHLKRSGAQEHDIKMSMLNNFDLFGVKQERIDWDKVARSDFEGNIGIEIHSNNLVLNPRLSKNILIVQANAGWKDSPLKEQRSQLLLLTHYLLIIDEYKKNIALQNSIKFITPYLEEHNVIVEKLNFLLNGDVSFQKSNNNNIKEIDRKKQSVKIDAKLSERVQNMSSRYDMDFTDHLWEILIATSEYPQMISYIEMILREIFEHRFIPQANDTNSTRIIKLASDMRGHEITSFISRLLLGSAPLELVVDAGFEKLARDYLYILRGARLVDLYDVRQKLANVSSGTFSTENYRKKLLTLAQIHISLECMLLIETHLECSVESLQSMFVHAYKEFLSELSSPLRHHAELCGRVYTLTVPLSGAIADELNILKTNPTVWRATLSSQSAASTLSTTTYYSKMPIFPTNIYPIDDKNAQEEMVHGISATSSAAKYKKL